MSKDSRKEFLNRIQKDTDNIADDWNGLVQDGTIRKIMERERKYKESGGYTELNPAEKNIGKEPGE